MIKETLGYRFWHVIHVCYWYCEPLGWRIQNKLLDWDRAAAFSGAVLISRSSKVLKQP